MPLERFGVGSVLGSRGQLDQLAPLLALVEVDADAWGSLYATVSRPFPRPSTGRIAVKVINDHGDEVMKVFDLE